MSRFSQYSTCLLYQDITRTDIIWITIIWIITLSLLLYQRKDELPIDPRQHYNYRRAEKVSSRIPE